METKAPAPTLKPAAKPIDAPPPRRKPQASEVHARYGPDGHSEWFVVAQNGHTLEDALDPTYCWPALSARVKPFDLIRIAHITHQFFVEQYVVSIDKDTQAILTYPLKVSDFSKEELRTANLDGAEIEMAGADKWRVRQRDRVLKGEFDTELEAVAWLKKKRAGGRPVA